MSSTQFCHPHRSHCPKALIGMQGEWFQTTPHGELIGGWGIIRGIKQYFSTKMQIISEATLGFTLPSFGAPAALLLDSAF